VSEDRTPFIGVGLAALAAAAMMGAGAPLAQVVRFPELEPRPRRNPSVVDPDPEPENVDTWPRRIVTVPDERLRDRSSPYNGPMGDDLRPFYEHMLGVLYDSRIGVGLSAVQIGVLSRICVVDLYAHQPARRSPRIFVNPEIVLGARFVNQREGCLSVPKQFGEVPRAVTIRASWLDLDGNRQEDELGGMLAHVLQHEIDHMDGVLFTQRRNES
jgi:peptide deformylase